MSNGLRVLALISVGLAFGSLGCSGSDLPAPVSVTPAASPALKAMFEDLAKSGELGSGGEQIRAELEKLKETDSAKGTALLTDFDKLAMLSNPDEVKAAAKKIAEKL